MFSRVYNIYESSAVASSTSAPNPTSIHSLDRAVDLADCLKTITADGQIIKKRSNSAVLKKDLDGAQKLPHFPLIIIILIIIVVINIMIMYERVRPMWSS